MPLYPIRDDTFPYIAIASEAPQLPWSFGNLLNAMDSSTMVRLSPRGLQLSSSKIVRKLNSKPWTYETCWPSPYVLCESLQMRWLPISNVDVPDDWGQLPHNNFMRMVNSSKACRTGLSERSINVYDTHYDVSLCDVLDMNLDLTVSPLQTANALIWRSDKTNIYEYVAIAIVSIYLVSCVSQNILDMFSKVQSNPADNTIRFADNVFLASVLIYWVVNASNGFVSNLLIYCDRALALHLVLHVALALAIHPWPGIQHSSIPGIHISAALSSVALLSMRVHFTFDNPYITLIVVLFAWRFFVKLFALFLKECNWVDTIAVFFDAFVLSSLLGNGTYNTDLTPERVQIQESMLILIGFGGAVASACNLMPCKQINA